MLCLAVDYTEACGPPDNSTADTLVACLLLGFIPGSQAVISLTYQPLQAKNYTVVGELVWAEDPPPDTVSANNTAVTWVNMVS